MLITKTQTPQCQIQTRVLGYKQQKGQALVLGLVALVVLAVCLVSQFSVGQVVATRARLDAATDAAAWSTATWQARVLNQIAYSNQAILAHEMAIAQATSLASYASFVRTFTETAVSASRVSYLISPPFARLLGVVGGLGQQAASRLESGTHLNASLDVMLRAESIANLQASQRALLELTQPFFLNTVATEVARVSDRSFFAYMVRGSETVNHMVRIRQRDRSMPLRDLVLQSLNASHHSRGTGGVFMRRRGGTELVDRQDRTTTQRWQAYDTLAIHTPIGEFAIAHGGSEVAVTPRRRLDELPSFFQARRSAAMRAQRDNPKTYQMASAGVWTISGRWSGLAEIPELNPESAALIKNPRFPVLRQTLVGRVQAPGNVHTAQDRSLVSGRLVMEDRFAGRDKNTIFSMATSEIYFRAPQDGVHQNELASLFSPYWQVRLVPNDEATTKTILRTYIQ